MAFIFWFSDFDGDGTENNAFIPFVRVLAQKSGGWVDGREYPEIEDGWAFGWGEFSDADIATLQASAFVTVIPTRDSGDNWLGVDDTVSQIKPAYRTAILNGMEAYNIPVDGLGLSSTVGEALRRVFYAVRIKELLRYLDFTEKVLSLTVGDIPALKRKALRRRITNYGFDLSNINDATTIRAALLDLFSQPSNYFTAPF